MVETRHSSKKVIEDDDTDSEVEQKATKSPSSLLSPRELRRKRREQLRTRSTGVGLTISTVAAAAPSNRRIVFSEGEEAAGPLQGELEKYVQEKDGIEPKNKGKDEDVVHTKKDDTDCDDDDDQVEEMKSHVAQEQEKQQRDKERASARVAVAVKTKRKRKNKRRTEADVEDDFDEEFFAQLDAEKADQRKTEKKEKLVEPRGRHTTFIVSGDVDEGPKEPLQADHNIEVVVLGDSSQKSRTLERLQGEPVSEAGLLYSRNRLVDGFDGISQKQRQKAKKTGHKLIGSKHWKRSKKMNRLLLPGVRARRKGQGKPAVHFVVQA